MMSITRFGKRWKLNDILANVYVLPQRTKLEEPSKQHHIDDGSQVANVSQQQVAHVAFLDIKEGNEDQPMEPLGSSRVMDSTGIKYS